MFGGLGFMVGGHMAVAVSGRGGLMVRCAPEGAAALLAEPDAEPFEMGGKPVRGWLRVHADDVGPWVRRGLAYVRTLRPK